MPGRPDALPRTAVCLTPTAHQLRVGHRGSALRCPLALALQAMFGGQWCVTPWMVQQLGPPDEARRWYLTPASTAWVVAWDDGKAVAGQTLRLLWEPEA